MVKFNLSGKQILSQMARLQTLTLFDLLCAIESEFRTLSCLTNHGNFVRVALQDLVRLCLPVLYTDQIKIH